MNKIVKNVKKIPLQPLYDITVKDNNSYTTVDGLIHHNTGIYYSATNIFIMGRQQVKDGKDIVGWKFVVNIEKSRSVKEKQKFILDIDEYEGLNKFSGLIELGEEAGFVVKPKQGWYAKVDRSTGEVIDKNYRLKDTQNSEFWDDILKDPEFDKFVQRKYKFGYVEQ